MAKQVILYNLAGHVTDEQYQDYVTNEKGPLLESLPSVEKFEMIRITSSMTGEIPYKYVGILHVKDLEEFKQKAVPSQKFQDFRTKWKTMVQAGNHSLFGEQIY